MCNRSAVIRACGALLGFAVAVGTVATLSAAALGSNRLEYLTFSGPVGLPGVTLARGTYTFEVADSNSAANVIRVRNRTSNEVVFLGFTHRSERPRGMARDRSIVLGESPRGVPAPIVAWYPINDVTGYEFIYRGKAR